ncbi:MAG: phosphonopyruvate decarboxylase [bacterium]|nr:phosphonopyruvate decarboxylase [bacterium]
MTASKLIDELKRYGLGPYFQVPCSLLAPLITELTQDQDCDVANPVNEAVAMGMSAGSYLATGKIPVVLMQNSGLCNTLNAHSSLNVTYSIPMLYIVSWRGQPGTKDAPQHEFMGKKTEALLQTFDIPYEVLDESSYQEQIGAMVRVIEKSQSPAALLLPRGLVESPPKSNDHQEESDLPSMGDIVDVIMQVSDGKACCVTTTGHLSREASYVSDKHGLEETCPSFYMLGSMGHALPIGLGVAGQKTGRKVVVIDGDGGCMMHMGAMASVGQADKAAGLIHIVIDNGVYASVGGQATVSGDIDFMKIASGCGYRDVRSAAGIDAVRQALAELLDTQGPAFLHVPVCYTGQRPKERVSSRYSCEEMKEMFVRLSCRAT